MILSYQSTQHILKNIIHVAKKYNYFSLLYLIKKMGENQVLPLASEHVCSYAA